VGWPRWAPGRRRHRHKRRRALRRRVRALFRILGFPHHLGYRRRRGLLSRLLRCPSRLCDRRSVSRRKALPEVSRVCEQVAAAAPAGRRARLGTRLRPTRASRGIRACGRRGHRVERLSDPSRKRGGTANRIRIRRLAGGRIFEAGDAGNVEGDGGFSFSSCWYQYERRSAIGQYPLGPPPAAHPCIAERNPSSLRRDGLASRWAEREQADFVQRQKLFPTREIRRHWRTAGAHPFTCRGSAPATGYGNPCVPALRTQRSSNVRAALRSSHASSSRMAYSFLRPRRTQRSSDSMCSVKKSTETASASAA
jgi:hypothetical protein